MSQHDELPPFEDRPEVSSPFSGSLRLLLGAVIGGSAAMAWVTMFSDARNAGEPAEPMPPTEVAAGDIAPASPAPAEQLLDAQARVTELESQLATAEQQLADVATATGEPLAAGGAGALVERVGSLRANLEAARDVRDRLKSDLREALARVEVSSARADRAQAAVTVWRHAKTRSQWGEFTARAKTELCDHGTRKTVDRCQAGVDAFFTEARYERFARCVNGGGAEPTLVSVKSGPVAESLSEPIVGEQLPRKATWYVTYCDPTLPEPAPTTP